MSSLSGLDVCVCMNNFSSKTTKCRDMFFFKDNLSIEDKNCLRHADLSVCLLEPATLSVKISTLYYNFLIDCLRDFSHVLHICTKPEVDSTVSISGLDLS